MSQISTRFLLITPHFWQLTVSSCGWSVMIFEPQFAQVMRRCSRPLREPHLHSQFPIANLTKSSEQVSRKSLKGKTLVKTDCNPVSSRSSGRRFICRNLSYDLRCTSMRFGNAM